MRSCVVCVVSVLMLVAGVASAAPIQNDDPCLGRWIGKGKNTGHPAVWTIDLMLSAGANGGRCGTIEYDNPKCGGTLESCEKKGDEIHTTERYTHQAADCAAPGKVILRCDGDEMKFAWVGWERVDTVLTRAGEPPAVAPPKSSSKPKPKHAEDEPTEDDDDEPQASEDDEPSRRAGCLPTCTFGSAGASSGWFAFGAALLAWSRRRAR